MPASSSPAHSSVSSLLSSSSRLLAAPLALVAFAACNEAEPGRFGNLDFVPDDCGRAICDFDDRLALGSTTSVYLNSLRDGGDVERLELESSAPWILDVLGREPGPARFTLIGNAPGRVDLSAFDGYGEVDYIPVDVVRIDRLTVEYDGTGVGSTDLVVDQFGNPMDHVIVNAGYVFELEIFPEASYEPVMGDFQYGVVLPPAIASALTSRSEIGRGFLEMYPPVGEHEVLFTAPGGAGHKIHLSVR